MKILSFFIATAFAGTLHVNQKPCGEIESVLIDKLGNAQVATSGECLAGTQPPTPPPVEPPPAPKCPANTLCYDRTWPVIPQQILSMRHDQNMIIKIKTTEAGRTGRLFTMYTTGDTATRLMVVSDKPGDFVLNKCSTKGLEVANLYWAQGGDSRGCVLPPNSDMYINIKFTNCEAGKTCRFYFGAN